MYERLLIVVDKRPITQAAVLEGTSLAASLAATVVFLHVLPRYTMPVSDAAMVAAVSAEEFNLAARADAEEVLGEACKIAEAAGVPAQAVVGSGETDAACVIEVAKQRDCDVIVVAAEARNALMRLLTGSAIPALITTSPLPVLICKPRPRYQAGVPALHAPEGAATPESSSVPTSAR